MQQELVLLSKGRKERKNRTMAHIYKIAFRTIPRFGATSILILTLGFYFTFSAGSVFLQIRDERSQPYEVTATTRSNQIDLNDLTQVNGVNAVSPLLQFNSTLTYQNHVLSCETKAVYSSYLTVQLIEGVIFPDNSNMPYLVLNKSAAESFLLEDKAVSIRASDTVLFTIGANQYTAVICGIFDDGKDTPMIYMSYDTANKLYSKDSSTELIFSLINKGAAESITTYLEKNSMSVSIDSDVFLTWDLMLQQFRQSMLTGIVLCICSAVLFVEKRTAEQKKCYSEQFMLLCGGLTKHEITKIFRLRMLIAQVMCLVIAMMVAHIRGDFNLLSVAWCCAIGICIFSFCMLRTKS